jgi:hypothetical protein
MLLLVIVKVAAQRLNEVAAMWGRGGRIYRCQEEEEE